MYEGRRSVITNVAYYYWTWALELRQGVSFLPTSWRLILELPS